MSGTHPQQPSVPGGAYDDELDLVRRSGLVLRVGRLTLGAGTGSYRVKASMAHVARALGIDRHQALVTLTEITTTSHRGRSFRTEVTELREVAVNADRLTRLQLLVSSLRARSVEPAELERRLDEIERRPPLYSPPLSGLWAAIACAAFAFLIGEGWVAMVAAAIGAGAGQIVRRLLAARHANQLGITMIAAAVASTLYLLVAWLVSETGLDPLDYQAGYIAAVLFLVPGFALVTSALDLARLDLSAGLARLTYALLIVTSSAMVVWAIAHTFGESPVPAHPDSASLLLRVAQLAASFAGVFGFALMFNSPWRTALVAAAVGAPSNLARLLLIDAGAAPAVAAAVGALAVGLVAAWVAPVMKVPRITVSVPGVVIMVPGTTAYLAMAGLGDGATSQAIAYAVQAGVIVLGIAVGLAAARMVTDRSWTFDR